MPSPLPVVFDLDGTLLDGDSTTAWMMARIRKSWFRVALAVLAAPFAIPLSVFAPTRRLGGSIFLWIASRGQNEVELRASFTAFVEQVSHREGVSWRAKGLACLEQHIQRGELVIVATAAPLWLAGPMVKSLGWPVTVVGSLLTPFLGGWIASYHCRHTAKCQAILRAGHGSRWSAAYSDSVDDLPLLSQSARAFFVNGSGRSKRYFGKTRIAVEHLVW